MGADFRHPILHALLQPGNVIARIGHPAVERHMLARMGGLLPDEGVDIGDKLGRCAVAKGADAVDEERRSEEHTSELQSLMRISYAVVCTKKNIYTTQYNKNYDKQSLHPP